MRYILVFYGFFIANLIIQRLRKSSKPKNIEEIFSGSEKFFNWRPLVIVSSLFATGFNLLFLVPAAELIDRLYISVLAYTISIVFIIRLITLIITAFFSSTLAEFSRENKPRESKNYLLDWCFLLTTALIIGVLIS